jgi:L-iditol 2-dehydrogenase
VQITPAIGWGQCRACATGHSNLCDNIRTIGFQLDGAFAEQMLVPGSAFRNGNVTRIENDLAYDVAVLAEPTACILNSHGPLQLPAAESLAIFGAGFIGCMHAEIALAAGVKTVIILEVDPARRTSAGQTIPEAVILDPGNPQYRDTVMTLTKGAGVDVAIVACSVGQAQQDAVNITAKRGRVSLFGGLAGQSSGYIDSNLVHYREIAVYGVHASTPVQNRQALALLASGTLRTQAYRHNIFALSDIERAFEALEDGRALKALVCPVPGFT